jgi:hypothetical protein
LAVLKTKVKSVNKYIFLLLQKEKSTPVGEGEGGWRKKGGV